MQETLDWFFVPYSASQRTAAGLVDAGRLEANNFFWSPTSCRITTACARASLLLLRFAVPASSVPSPYRCWLDDDSAVDDDDDDDDDDDALKYRSESLSEGSWWLLDFQPKIGIEVQRVFT